MPKPVAFLLFVLLAPVAAGLFGVLHDQISYTVAPEYFTHFKFDQFALQASDLPERVRASIVGWRASWWMGIPLGVLGGFALFSGDQSRVRFESVWKSLAAMMLATLLVALGGLVYGFMVTREIDVAAYAGWFIPDGVDLRRFLTAGHMHNAAYLGGLLALPAAWWVQVRLGRRPGLP